MHPILETHSMKPGCPPTVPGFRLVYVDEINHFSPLWYKLNSVNRNLPLWLINGWIEGTINNGRDAKVVTDNTRTFEDSGTCLMVNSNYPVIFRGCTI